MKTGTHASRRGFTLTEIMVAAALSLLVVAAVTSIVIASIKSSRKTQLFSDAIENTRLVQEHLKIEISSAIKRDSIAPGLGLAFDLSNGGSPARYARLTYRVPVGNPMLVAANAVKTDDSLQLKAPAGATIEIGDYVVISRPKTSDNLRVTAVTDPGPGSDRVVKVAFAMTIETATDGDPLDIDQPTYVSVYRERKYEVAAPGASGVTTLRWWENTSDNSKVRTLSANVPAASRYMFRPIPDDLTATEHAVQWQYDYAGTDPVVAQLGGNADFWNANHTGGVLWARSGDPENLTGYSNGARNQPCTAPSTTKTTSTKTTSIKTTSTKKPSTTSNTTKTTSIKTTKTTTTKTTTTSVRYDG